jgi:hypothetical protein
MKTDDRISFVFSLFNEKINEIQDFIANQFYGFIRKRIIDYAKKNDGITEKVIYNGDIAFRKENGEINQFDVYLLYSTFRFMVKTKQFNEIHRGRGHPIIYKVKE